MAEHVYRVISLVGSGPSVDQAIQTAIARASKTLRQLRWFEVEQVRGQIENEKPQFQVLLKVGFTMEDTVD